MTLSTGLNAQAVFKPEHLESSLKLNELVIVDPARSSSADITGVDGVRGEVNRRTVSRWTGRILVVARIPSGDHGASGTSEASTWHVGPRVAALRDRLVAMGAAVLGVFGGTVVGSLPAAIAWRTLDSHE